MPLKFLCECGRVIIVSARVAKAEIACPKCGRRLDGVPATKRDDEPAPPPVVRKPSSLARDLPEPEPPPIQNPQQRRSHPSEITTPRPTSVAGESELQHEQPPEPDHGAANSDFKTDKQRKEAPKPPASKPKKDTQKKGPAKAPESAEESTSVAPSAAEKLASSPSGAHDKKAGPGEEKQTHSIDQHAEARPKQSLATPRQSKPKSKRERRRRRKQGDQNESKTLSPGSQESRKREQASQSFPEADGAPERESPAPSQASADGAVERSIAHKAEEPQAAEKPKPVKKVSEAREASKPSYDSRSSASSPLPQGPPPERRTTADARQSVAPATEEKLEESPPAATRSTPAKDETPASINVTDSAGSVSETMPTERGSTGPVPEIADEDAFEPAPPPKASRKAAPDPEAALRDAPPVQDGDAVIYGVEHDPDRIAACFTLAFAMIFSAIFGAAPAIYQAAVFLTATEPPKIETWSLLLAVVAMMQIAYAIYLMQAPDWITAQVAAYFLVGLSAMQAAALGVIAFSSTTGGVVRFLQIFSYHADKRALGWCFIMLLVTAVIAYYAGRFAHRWKLEETEIELDEV